MTLLLGLGLAGLSAAASQAGFLFREKGANRAPKVDVRRPGRTTVALFRQKWWSIGFGLAVVAYLMHVGALGLAALSLVQAVLAGGLVLLGVFAERFFGLELNRRQWIGMGLAAGGLALLAVTGEASSGQKSADHSVVAMIAFESGLVGLGVGALLFCRVERWSPHHGVALALAAGTLYALTHVAVKALSASVDRSALDILLSPYLLVVVVGGVLAFFASARSLQLGPAVPVIAVTSIAGNALAVPAGIIVFGDPLGDDAFTVAVRLAAFLAVMAAAAFIPAPTGAARELRQRPSAPQFSSARAAQSAR
jgi:drug/metabolite transporter (DMT)-like permease